MATSSDSRSAPCAQRQNPPPALHDAASRGELGVVSTGRRNLLGALALAPIAGAPTAGAAEAADPHLGWLQEAFDARDRDNAADDPHIEWWREHEALGADAEGLDDEDYDALGLGQCDLMERIATTPASTIAGVLIQLRVVQFGIELGAAEFDADAMANAMATLEQLGGRI